MYEDWRPVVGYVGRYEVSDHGRVRSVTRVIEQRSPHGQLVRYQRVGRLLRAKDNSGYRYVNLYQQGRVASVGVHTLVLAAFAGDRPFGAEARHLNGRRADNRLCNLAWGSHAENQHDRIAHRTSNRGVDGVRRTKISAADARRIRELPGLHRAIAAEYGVSPTLVSAIKRREVWDYV